MFCFRSLLGTLLVSSVISCALFFHHVNETALKCKLTLQLYPTLQVSWYIPLSAGIAGSAYMWRLPSGIICPHFAEQVSAVKG
jgi:hypothetical protein